MIVRGMFGIRPTRPGFRNFEVRPQVGDLPYASIRVPTVKGPIVVSLGQNREAYEVEITVPANTTGTVYLPAVAGGADTLFVNNQKANFPLEDGCFVIELGAGTHRLQAQ
jgi:alpha-L-rhamnosidase